MPILKVARMGHPVLRIKARPVPQSEIGSTPVQALIDGMLATMIEYRGVGLAAPQVHESVRIFVAQVVTDDSDDEASESDRPAEHPPAEQPEAEDPATEPTVLVLVNPEITPVGRHTTEDWEGCLSIPDMRGLVTRHRDIRLRAFDRTGERIEIEASGYMARVLQHEFDHLDGVLFPDRMKTLQSLTFIDEYLRYHAG